MRIGQCPLSPPPSPPHASPPLPLLHRQSATAAAPGRWQYATAAATGTADITTTVAAAGIAAADWDTSGCVASAQNGTLWPCARCIPKRLASLMALQLARLSWRDQPRHGRGALQYYRYACAAAAAAATVGASRGSAVVDHVAPHTGDDYAARWLQHADNWLVTVVCMRLQHRYAAVVLGCGVVSSRLP